LNFYLFYYFLVPIHHYLSNRIGSLPKTYPYTSFIAYGQVEGTGEIRVGVTLFMLGERAFIIVIFTF